MNYSYIIVDDNLESVKQTKLLADRFEHLSFIAAAHSYDEGIDLILEHQPSLIFLEINPSNPESKLSFGLISELYRYLKVIPKIIITTTTKEYAFEALKYEVVDYLLKPLRLADFRKAIFRLIREIEVTYTTVSPTIALKEKAVAAVASAVSFDLPTEIEPREELETDMVLPPAEDEFTDKSIEIEPLVDSSPINPETDADTILEAIDSTVNPEETLLEEEMPPTVEEETSVDELEKEVATEVVTATITPSETQELPSDLAEETVTFSSNGEEKNKIEPPKSLTICIKSYGDYRYIDSDDILYFEADNNSTDIHLNNGEMITAFKTLKHFESVLPKSGFLRIHNSYIININQVSRIHTGNALCYIKNSTVKLPFSKSYKDNVDLIIAKIAGGNYLEI